MDTEIHKLLKVFLSGLVLLLLSGLVIDWKSIASKIYNQINKKNTIYLNFMKNINQKLSKVGFCNINQKTATAFVDSNLSSFESDQPSVVNVPSYRWMLKKKFQSFFPGFGDLSTILKIGME